MMRILPIVMIKNEERFIQAVLRPLIDVFGTAVVGDTGSTDQTISLVKTVLGVHLLELGPLTPAQVGTARQTLSEEAGRLGAEWIMVVDGDELHCREGLRSIRTAEMPTGMELGFLTMRSIDEDLSGHWELDDLFNQARINRADAPWLGVYPFEAPEPWLSGRQKFFYFPLPAGLPYHAVHLHRLARSSADDQVHLRQQKQFKFSMQERQIARLGRFDMAAWLAR